MTAATCSPAPSLPAPQAAPCALPDLQNLPIGAFGGCEFATFRCPPQVDAARLADAAARMRDGFLRGQAGFLGHALLRGGSCGDGGEGGGTQWADVVFTATQADAERICTAFMDHAVCRDYVALMEPGSAALGFWTRAG